MPHGPEFFHGSWGSVVCGCSVNLVVVAWVSRLPTLPGNVMYINIWISVGLN